MACAGFVLGGVGGRAPAFLDAFIGVVAHFERLPPGEDIGDAQFPGAAVTAAVTEFFLLNAPFMALLDILLGVLGRAAAQRKEFGIASDLLRQVGQDVEGDQQPHVARGRRVVFPGADGFEDGRARGHGNDGAAMLLEVAFAIVDGFDARLELFLQGIQHGVVGLLGRLSLRVDGLAHGGVEIVGAHFVLFFRVGRDRGIDGQPGVAWQLGPVAVHEDRAEGLEAGPGRRGVGEQEVALPEALSGHRVVRLGIDGIQGAGPPADLGRPFGDDQGVAVGIGINGAGPEGLPIQGDGVEVGGFVGESGAGAAGMHGVGDLPHQAVEPRHGDRAANKAIIQRGRAAARGALGGAAVTGAKGDRQTDLPGEVGAQEIGQVGTIRGGRQFPVFVETQVIEEKVAILIAQDRLEGFEAQVLAVRGVEEFLDPGGVEGFHGLRPGCVGGGAAPVGVGATRGYLAAADDLTSATDFQQQGAGRRKSGFSLQTPGRPAAPPGREGSPRSPPVTGRNAVRRAIRGHGQDPEGFSGGWMGGRGPDARFFGFHAFRGHGCRGGQTPTRGPQGEQQQRQ